MEWPAAWSMGHPFRAGELGHSGAGDGSFGYRVRVDDWPTLHAAGRGGGGGEQARCFGIPCWSDLGLTGS